jgi:hypothetical protein
MWLLIDVEKCMRRRARSESDLFSPCGIIASKKNATELGKFETGSATKLVNPRFQLRIRRLRYGL